MATYSFRFRVIENITATSARINAAFGRMTSTAGTFANRVNRIPASIDRLENEMRQLQRAQSQSFDTREIRRYGREIDAVRERIRRLRGEQSQGAGRGGFSMGLPMLGGFGGIVAGAGAGMAISSSFKEAMAAESLDNALQFTSGSPEKAAARIKNVRNVVNTLGLPLKESMIGFKTLDASLMGTGMEKQSEGIFKGVSVGVSALGMTAENAQGIYLALGQIASKGKVQAEELRGQIGERLPGAFNIAARAMGVTGAELDKMMEQGKLSAKDFLPKFAAEVQKTFGGALPKSVNSAQAKWHRFNNAIYDLKVFFGTQLMPAILPAMTRITEMLSGMIGWIVRNKETLMTLAQTIAYTGAIIGIAAGAQMIWNGIVTVSTFLTGGFTGALALMNDVFMANPVAWVVGLFAALTAGIIFAWNRFEGFRGFLVGMWAVIKEVGSIIYDYMIAPFLSFGKVLAGIFTFDTNLIKAGITDSMAAIEKMTKSDDIGQRIGKAFAGGWNDGVANQTKIDPLGSLFGSKKPENAGGAAADNKTLFDSLGMADPTAKGGAGGAKGDGIGLNSKLESSVQGGREGVKNVSIIVQKQIENLTFQNVNGLTESKEIIRRELEKVLLTVLNDANYAT